MVRRSLLALSRSPGARTHLPRLPFVRRAVRRFMPGETAAQAVDASVRLQGEGMGTVLTLLGEDVTSPAEARRVVDDYLALLDAVRQAGVDAHLSVKPTQLGLGLGGGGALDNLLAVASGARAVGIPVWVDMEGSSTVDATLDLYRGLKEHHADAGLCLQAYLHRTPADLDALLPIEPHIRLVKGAYAEPPSEAFPVKADVDAAYAALTTTLLRAAAGGKGVAVLGTHDGVLIERARREVAELGVPDEAWAIHMLYGIQEAEQARLRSAGVPLRVLISYGPAWFPWYMRRLAERPANLWFVARSLAG